VVEENGKRTGDCLPVASRDRRVDTGKPAFSKPTEVTNPLHPTATVAQAILMRLHGSALAAGRYVETAAGWGCGFALAVQTGGSSTAMLDDNES
jgi:hypothetical protein